MLRALMWQTIPVTTPDCSTMGRSHPGKAHLLPDRAKSLFSVESDGSTIRR